MAGPTVEALTDAEAPDGPASPASGIDENAAVNQLMLKGFLSTGMFILTPIISDIMQEAMRDPE